MKRKRFVKLMRALNAQARKDGCPCELRETIVRLISCGRFHYERDGKPIYQDLWTLNREVACRRFLELVDAEVEANADAEFPQLDEKQRKDLKEMVRYLVIDERPIFLIEK